MAAAANSRMTFAAVLGTIQTTANTVTATVDAANKGIGMLNKLVSDASARQAARSDYDMAIFVKTLHQEKTQELTESRLRIDQYIQQSPRHAELYAAAFNELATIAEKHKA